MASKKIQLYTDRANTIEASPETSANCVILSDGNDLQKVLDNDLTTPTVVHEETSFKVGVGDVNVSSSVVDGEVGRMVIKGKTYQNILPEPSTPVLTNNKEMFKVNEGLYPNVEVVDGISKSAILSGQTLVNLSGQLTHHEKWVETGDDLVLNLPSGNGQPRINVGLVYKLKKDTIYTVVINMKLYETGYPHICFMDESNRQLASDREWTPSSTGVLKTTFTTSSTVEASILRIIPRNGIDNIYTIGKKIIILEGDYTNQDIPYFEGMSSCKMPVLKTVGKNLFDKEAFYNDWKSKQPAYMYKEIVDGEEVLKINNLNLLWEDEKGFKIPVEIGVPLTLILKCKKAGSSTTNAILFVRYGDSSASTVGKCTSDNWESLKTTFTPTRNYITICSAYNVNDYFYIKDIQLEQGSIATSYEPYKTNILSTPEEVVLRSLSNGVKDTLNCMTGEYVQHIKEVVFDGSSDESIGMVNVNDTTLVRFNINNVAGVQTGNTNKVLCSSLPYLYIHGLSGGSATVSQECISNHSQDANVINIVIKRSRLSSVDVAGFRAYLQSNPITIQYSIATPIVKTVDLSSSGNWEKVVLDGSEDWGADGSYCFCRNLQINSACAFTDSIPVLPTKTNSLPSHASFSGARYFTVLIDGILNDPVKLKQYLSQNPMTVWYQTETHKDSTQVKQPIFFKDGHIQLSSGADNSLIPTLDYQAKTSNSYVMDLMKTNTKYTMKAKSASGTFTIDGTSYGAGTNETFTTPTSMTNKFLVMSNNANEEIMILEGDVTDKTIPYFKGIKSAFEGEDKIEVLSTGKNLFKQKLTDYDYLGNYAENETIIKDDCIEWNATTSYKGAVYYYINVKPNTKYTLSLQRNIQQTNCVTIYDGFVTSNVNNITSMGANKNSVTFNTKSDKITIRFSNGTILDTLFKIYDVQLEESSIPTQYELHKSNCTKIPLLSPLRSLPNGVCDELNIDRMKKKATLIQRVGNYTSNGSDSWGLNSVGATTSLFTTPSNFPQNSTSRWCNNFLNTSFNLQYDDYEGLGCWGAKTNFNVRIKQWRVPTTGVTAIDTPMFKKWLFLNPITIYYEMATPIVTEIDLEGFPYVYKDGHIFLNSEIAPVVEIDYNVNQSQQIQANNETLQRHELDILDLDNLIVSFVNAEYNLRLLKFDMELSMMALDE